MKRKYLILIIFLLLLFAIISFVNAKDTKIYTGDEITNISNLNKIKDDSYITLKGYISKKIKDNKYYFKDSTGEIILEIDKKLNNQVKKISKNTLVEVYGEFDKKDSYDEKNELEVKKITIMN